MHDGIDFAYGGKELVSEPFPFGSTPHEPGNIDERNARRNDLFRLPKRNQLVQPRIRHGDFANVRLDGAKWIVGRLGGRRLCKSIKECRLADVRQTDNAALKSHGLIVSLHRYLEGCSSSSLPSKPLASMARWILFWNVESLPSMRRGALSAITSQSASTQAHSLFAKSPSTCEGTSSLTSGLPMPMRTRL